MKSLVFRLGLLDEAYELAKKALLPLWSRLYVF